MNMKRILIVATLALLASGCSYASEQGTVQVETSYGKIVAVHQPGDTFSCWGYGCEEYAVDLRDHKDGIDCSGVTKDNIAFYMKVDVVYRPIADKIPEYVSLFGADNDEGERDKKRWNVLQQHVMNACRNATSGKYDAYGLRAEQSKVLTEMSNELQPRLAGEMYLKLSSVGMEIQPQFTDPRIDEAANSVVAAQKQKEAETALKNAAEEKAKRQQIEAQIYANPLAYKIEELKLLKDIEQVRANGIAGHQGTLIIGSSPSLQLQLPAGGK